MLLFELQTSKTISGAPHYLEIFNAAALHYLPKSDIKLKLIKEVTDTENQLVKTRGTVSGAFLIRICFAVDPLLPEARDQGFLPGFAVSAKAGTIKRAAAQNIVVD